MQNESGVRFSLQTYVYDSKKGIMKYISTVTFIKFCLLYYLPIDVNDRTVPFLWAGMNCRLFQ